MQAEIEVKFLGVNHDDVRNTLKNAGATLEKPMRTMRRYIFDVPAARETADAHVRVRDEGDKVTIAYKDYGALTVDSTQEVETTVGDFDKAVALLRAAGLPVKSFQETRRETWRLGSCEVVLDEWPWLRPFIEIEGPSEKEIRACAASLGFDWSKGVFGSATIAYRAEFAIPRPLSIGECERIAFDEPVPAWLEKIRRTDVES